MTTSTSTSITIRPATDADMPALQRLAQLDSRPVPAGDTLLGFVGADLRAAVQSDGTHAVADPFAPTAQLLELLHTRAAAGRNGPRRHRRGALASLVPRLA